MVKREPLWSKEGPRPLKKEEVFGHVISLAQGWNPYNSSVAQSILLDTEDAFHLRIAYPKIDIDQFLASQF